MVAALPAMVALTTTVVVLVLAARTVLGRLVAVQVAPSLRVAAVVAQTGALLVGRVQVRRPALVVIQVLELGLPELVARLERQMPPMELWALVAVVGGASIPVAPWGMAATAVMTGITAAAVVVRAAATMARQAEHREPAAHPEAAVVGVALLQPEASALSRSPTRDLILTR